MTSEVETAIWTTAKSSGSNIDQIIYLQFTRVTLLLGKHKDELPYYPIKVLIFSKCLSGKHVNHTQTYASLRHPNLY